MIGEHNKTRFCEACNASLVWFRFWYARLVLHALLMYSLISFCGYCIEHPAGIGWALGSLDLLHIHLGPTAMPYYLYFILLIS